MDDDEIMRQINARAGGDDDIDDEYIDQIFSEFNSLSIVYRKPEEKFAKYIPDDIHEEDEDKNDEEEQIEDKPLPSNNEAQNMQTNFDNNNINNEQVQIHNIGNINEDSLKADYYKY